MYLTSVAGDTRVTVMKASGLEFQIQILPPSFTSYCLWLSYLTSLRPVSWTYYQKTVMRIKIYV